MISLPCPLPDKGVHHKEEDKDYQHTAGLVEVDSSWEGDEAVLVDGGADRRSCEASDSLKTAHECVDLNQSDERTESIDQ